MESTREANSAASLLGVAIRTACPISRAPRFFPRQRQTTVPDGFESLVGAAGIEPATLCLAAGPAFLRGLDYIFGIAAALLIVSEDSPLRAIPSRRGCLLIALTGLPHRIIRCDGDPGVPSIPQRPAYGFISPHALLIEGRCSIH